MEETTETTQAENTQEVQSSPEQTSPAVESQAADQEVTQSKETQSKPEGGNRAQRRITDLSRQLRESQAESERLKAQADANAFFNQTHKSDPWSNVDPDGIPVDQLKSIVDQTSSSAAEFTVQKEIEKLRRESAEKEYMRDLELDSRKLEAENPRFNPLSPEFDQEYVDEMSDLYRDAYLGKPNAPKPSEFVARMERVRAKAEAQGVERSSAQLAQQAAQGAVVGSGSTSKQESNPLAQAFEEAKRTGKWEPYFIAEARLNHQ